MDLISLLNQPIFTTLVSLLVGSFLIGWLTDRWAKKEKIRDKAIELLNEASLEVNAVTDHILRIVLSGKVDEKNLASLNEQVNLLTQTRMNRRIRSSAYIPEPDFYLKYELLVWQLHRIRELLNDLLKPLESADLQSMAAAVQKLQAQLDEKWPFPAADDFSPPGLEFPYAELFKLMSRLIDRAVVLFSTNLKSAMK